MDALSETSGAVVIHSTGLIKDRQDRGCRDQWTYQVVCWVWGSARFPSDLLQVSQFPSWGSHRSLKSGTHASGSCQPWGLGYHWAAFYLDGLQTEWQFQCFACASPSCSRTLRLSISSHADSSWLQLLPDSSRTILRGR